LSWHNKEHTGECDRNHTGCCITRLKCVVWHTQCY
jgi:hypothetical protein